MNGGEAGGGVLNEPVQVMAGTSTCHLPCPSLGLCASSSASCAAGAPLKQGSGKLSHGLMVLHGATCLKTSRQGLQLDVDMQTFSPFLSDPLHGMACNDAMCQSASPLLLKARYDGLIQAAPSAPDPQASCSIFAA